MALKYLLAASLLGLAACQSKIAKTYTGWNCCKPGCASVYDTNTLAQRGSVKVCDARNDPLSNEAGRTSQSTCEGARSDTGFLCEDYLPVPVSEELSYGFVIHVGGDLTGDNPNCCKCYELEWLTGAAAETGKKMIVQVAYPGGTGGDIVADDLIILTPGGGLGPVGNACQNQYGSSYDWGNPFGGIAQGPQCDGLPDNLQGGCYWRFNWANGDINGWEAVYRPVECPSRLTDISGCASNP